MLILLEILSKVTRKTLRASLFLLPFLLMINMPTVENFLRLMTLSPIRSLKNPQNSRIWKNRTGREVLSQSIQDALILLEGRNADLFFTLGSFKYLQWGYIGLTESAWPMRVVLPESPQNPCLFGFRKEGLFGIVFLGDFEKGEIPACINLCQKLEQTRYVALYHCH